MRSISAILAAIGILFSTGCGGLLSQHTEQFDTMRAMAATVADRLGEGAIAQAQVSGQGIEPGIKVEAGQVFYATAYYKGLAGQFMTATQGTLEKSEGGSDRMWETANSKANARREVRQGIGSALRKVPATESSGTVTAEHTTVVVPEAGPGLAVTVLDVDLDEDKAFGRVDGKLVVIAGGGHLRKGQTVSVTVDKSTATSVFASLSE